MKITCLIDSLGSGGAQRQMCMLASLLKKQGDEVQVMTYFPQDFFAPLLKEGVVPWRVIPWKNKCHRIFAVRKALRQARPDVVIAYLETPSLMAELATVPARPFKLIVSERNTTLSPNAKNRLYYNFHRLADVVVPNSYSQQNVLEKVAPYLKEKTTTILNCVDLEKFHPAYSPLKDNKMRMVVVGSIHPQKNTLVFLEALHDAIRVNQKMEISVDWYGDSTLIDGNEAHNSSYYSQVCQAIKDLSLQEVFYLHPRTNEILNVYQEATVFCLPSIYEGCPNVVGEAMACGKPILASNVGDCEALVKDHENGFLFKSPTKEDITETILKFCDLTPDQKAKMGTASRSRAERLLSPDILLQGYLEQIKQITKSES
ncbi:MAG: glycosyltransferase family 4 protein [Deltaproteobacteria bacterium]|nr:glycosyltransferase family 4 protein [Deltaproteobacteria bacterium]